MFPNPQVATEWCQNPCTFYNVIGRNDRFFLWDGFPTQIVIADPTSGLTTIAWNLCSFFNNCCELTALTFTAGLQVYVVPASAIESGSYTFPAPVADGVFITATMTDCNGTTTQRAFDNRVGDNCQFKFENIPNLILQWALQACGLAPCSCAVPFNILVGGVVTGVIDKDSKFHPTNDLWNPNKATFAGTRVDGSMSLNCDDACIPDTLVSLGFTPGLAPGTLVQAEINGVLYPFAPLNCISVNPIAGVCVPGGGGGSGLFTTISSDGGSLTLVQSTNPDGSPNVNIEIPAATLTAISDNSSDIADIVADNDDFQASYNNNTDWVISGANYRLLIAHGFGNAPGLLPVSEAIITATGEPFVPAEIVIVNGNTLAYDVPSIPDGRAAITVVVKRSNIVI